MFPQQNIYIVHSHFPGDNLGVTHVITRRKTQVLCVNPSHLAKLRQPHLFAPFIKQVKKISGNPISKVSRGSNTL